MNKEQEAVTTWFASEEGISCVTPFNATGDDVIYLRNRLWRAFTAGMAAGREIERQNKNEE